MYEPNSSEQIMVELDEAFNGFKAVYERLQAGLDTQAKQLALEREALEADRKRFEHDVASKAALHGPTAATRADLDALEARLDQRLSAHFSNQQGQSSSPSPGPGQGSGPNSAPPPAANGVGSPASPHHPVNPYAACGGGPAQSKPAVKGPPGAPPVWNPPPQAAGAYPPGLGGPSSSSSSMAMPQSAPAIPMKCPPPAAGGSPSPPPLPADAIVAPGAPTLKVKAPPGGPPAPQAKAAPIATKAPPSNSYNQGNYSPGAGPAQGAAAPAPAPAPIANMSTAGCCPPPPPPGQGQAPPQDFGEQLPQAPPPPQGVDHSRLPGSAPTQAPQDYNYYGAPPSW